MSGLFLDSDVLLDFFLGRQPFATDITILFSLAKKNRVQVYTSSLTVSNMYYFMRKGLGHKSALKALTDFVADVNILPVDKTTISSALISDFSDFEDSIQHECAISEKNIKYIVTRNTKDYKKSKLTVMTPAEVLPLVDI